MIVKELGKDRTTRKSLVRKLDKIVSEIVILRDKKCVTCNSYDRLGCGHLFSRIAYSTRWELLNCACQCFICNYRHELDAYRYTKWFLDKYGQDEYDKLHVQYETPVVLKDWQLKEIYDQLVTIKKTYEV